MVRENERWDENSSDEQPPPYNGGTMTLLEQHKWRGFSHGTHFVRHCFQRKPRDSTDHFEKSGGFVESFEA